MVGLAVAVLLVIGAAALDGGERGGEPAVGGGAVASMAGPGVGARAAKNSSAVDVASAGGSVASVQVGEVAARIFEPSAHYEGLFPG